MAKTKLIGKDRERHIEEQKKIAKKANKKKRRSPARFFKDVGNELKKVTWPTGKELVKYTIAVIVFIVIMAVITGVFDLGLSALYNLLMKKP